jgi:predicted nucleic acid-binding protein
MNLFIDTNVLLSFYHYSSDDLEELQKLTVLISEGQVTLILPEQVVSEFRRNREAKIADALKRFTAERLNDQFPQITKDYDEYECTRSVNRVTADRRFWNGSCDAAVGATAGCYAAAC